MRRAATALAAIACACAAPRTVAAPPAVPAAAPPAGAPGALPAALADANAVLDAARLLRSEIDALSKLPPDTVRDARVAYRRVAFDLLFHGGAAPGGDACDASARRRVQPAGPQPASAAGAVGGAGVADAHQPLREYGRPAVRCVGREHS